MKETRRQHNIFNRTLAGSRRQGINQDERGDKQKRTESRDEGTHKREKLVLDVENDEHCLVTESKAPLVRVSTPAL